MTKILVTARAHEAETARKICDALSGKSPTDGSDEPFKIRLFVKGEDSGCYSFRTQEEADEHYEWSTKNLGVLGCRYKKEYPND